MTEKTLSQSFQKPNPMTGHQILIEKVREMRYLQKRYFITRDKKILIESKKLEAIVDNLIADKLF